MKIILNKCYGGFDFSDEMKEELTKKGIGNNIFMNIKSNSL